MRNRERMLPVAAGAAALSALVIPMAVRGASLKDGKAAFDRREDR